MHCKLNELLLKFKCKKYNCINQKSNINESIGTLQK